MRIFKEHWEFENIPKTLGSKRFKVKVCTPKGDNMSRYSTFTKEIYLDEVLICNGSWMIDDDVTGWGYDGSENEPSFPDMIHQWLTHR